MGFVDLPRRGSPPAARQHFFDSLETARVTDVRLYLDGSLLGLALATSAIGETTVAATLHGVADAQCERAGRVLEVLEAGLRDRDHARLRADLGDAEFDVAYRRGHTLSPADGIALATGMAEADPGIATTLAAADLAAVDGSASPLAAGPLAASPLAAGPLATGPLSERERGIVALVAGGATDAQIAEELFLSINTVRSHLERIRDKTGARRRAELARYAMEAGIEPLPFLLTASPSSTQRDRR